MPCRQSFWRVMAKAKVSLSYAVVIYIFRLEIFFSYFARLSALPGAEW